MSKTNNINKIVILDDHQIMREGLQSLFESHSEWNLAGEGDLEQAPVLLKKHHPRIIIMGINVAQPSHFQMIRRIRQDYPTVKILVLSLFTQPRQVADFFHAGVHGYMLKNAAFDELLQALREIETSNKYIPIQLAGALKIKESPPNLLTNREAQILKYLVSGKGSKEIGLSLDLSSKTIDSYRRNILKKLKLKNLAELIKYSLREGLIKL